MEEAAPGFAERRSRKGERCDQDRSRHPSCAHGTILVSDVSKKSTSALHFVTFGAAGPGLIAVAVRANDSPAMCFRERADPLPQRPSD